AVNIASGSVTPLGPASSGTVLRGCLGANLVFATQESVVSLLPIVGGTPTPLFTALPVRALYCDGQVLYATNGASSDSSGKPLGELRSYHLPSGPLEHRSLALGEAGAIVRLGTHLFWLNRNEGTIARMPLP